MCCDRADVVVHWVLAELVKKVGLGRAQNMAVESGRLVGTAQRHKERRVTT